MDGERRVRFRNVFTGRSLQFATQGNALGGARLHATNGARSRLLTLKLDDPDAVRDEARMLAAFAFWSADPSDTPPS